MTLKELIQEPNVKIIDKVAQFRREPKRWCNRIYVIGSTMKMPQRKTAYRFGLCEGVNKSN